MAKINDNLLVKGARGNMGKQFVYKKRGNNTHIARMPQVNKNQTSTERQLEVRELFTEAAAYAKSAIASPELKKLYQKKAQPGATAYNVAFRDFLKPPVVKTIDTSGYDGVTGSTIVVKAKDDFKVASVTVVILNGNGELVEQGEAILNPLNNNKWIYSATADNLSINGSTITATAKDIPGNEGILEVIL